MPLPRTVPDTREPGWPVEIATSNGTTGATLVWRWQGRLYLTAVVKATFALVPGGAMTARSPEPIAAGEQEDASGLRHAGDLVPFRRRVDVTVTGHTLLLRGTDDALVPVRFSLLRDGAPVLAAASHLSPPGAPRFHGLGPLSRRWPVRSRLIGDHDPRRFEGASIDLPAAFDESYFQAAPAGQRLDALRGDEQLVLEGDGSRIETRLPGARVTATLYGPTAEYGAEPIDLAIDALHVDLDRASCNVTWRGTTTVERRDALVSKRVIAVLDLPAAPDARHPFESVLWGRPEALKRTFAARPEPKPPSQRAPAYDDRDSLDRRIFPGVAPVSPPPPPMPSAAAEQSPLDATSMLPPELDPASSRSLLQAAVPASERVPLRTPSARRREEAPEVTAVTATMVLADALLPPPAALATEDEPEEITEADVEAVELDATMGLSHHAVLAGLATPATPFVPVAPAKVAPPPMVAPLPVVAPPLMTLAPQGGTERDASPWAAEASPTLPAAPVLPRGAVPANDPEAPSTQRTPAPVSQAVPLRPALPQPAAGPRTAAMTFGEHFLAAMGPDDGLAPRHEPAQESRAISPFELSILEEHAEQAAFLWTLREAAASDPRYDPKGLGRLDERVEACLDSLRLAEDKGWEVARAALDFPDEGTAFVTAVLAVTRADRAGFAGVLDTLGRKPICMAGVVGALGWAPFDAVARILPGLLSPGAPPALHYLGIAASALHRRDPGPVLASAIGASDALLRARALAAAGELGRADLRPALRDALLDQDDACRFAAGFAGVLLGEPEAVRALVGLAEAGGPFAERACATAVRRMPVGEARAWLLALAERPGAARTALFGAAALGDVQMVPWVLDCMSNPALARLAAGSMAMITGADFFTGGLKGKAPEGFVSEPTDDPEDDDVAMAPDESWPWPDGAAVKRWWDEKRGGFAKDRRYLMGRPVEGEWLEELLRSGYQHVRAAAAEELCVAGRRKVLAEVRGRAGRASVGKVARGSGVGSTGHRATAEV